MRRSRSRLVLCVLGVLAASFAACLVAVPAFAETVSPERLRVADGELLVENGTVYGEAFELPADLSRALAAVPERGRVELLELPLAPGVRRSVVLRRAAIYAPGARLWVDDGRELREVPRSSKIRFLGADPADPHWRVGLWLDPATGELGGVTAGPEGEFDLVAARAGSGQYRLTELGHGEPELESECGNNHALRLGEEDLGLPKGILYEAVPPVPKGATIEPDYQITVAIDTDNEFLWKRFGNDTGSAIDWIADLFVAMNVFYERDLGLHLLQGETFLRTDSGNPPNYDADPWSETSPFNGLLETGEYWATTYPQIDRAFVSLLSGKRESGGSFSGIAWVGPSTYCNSVYGYNYNQTFHSPGVSVSLHASFIGHEIGHNSGSSHTHCYTPEIDQCWNAEDDCYTGGTSCPGGTSGTIMSYCHLIGCGGPRQEFHPTVQSRIESYFSPPRYPGCIEDFELPGLIFTDGFESGNTTAWGL